METEKKVLGLEHPDALLSISSHAIIYKSRSRGEDVEELLVKEIRDKEEDIGT